MISQKGFSNSFELLPRSFFHFFQLIMKLIIIYQLPDLRTYKNPILDFSVTLGNVFFRYRIPVPC